MPGLASLPMALNHSGPLAMIGGNVEPGLDVVDVGRLAPQASSGPGKADAGADRARHALERSDERRLFAADESACALGQLDIEVESAAEDVLADQRHSLVA